LTPKIKFMNIVLGAEEELKQKPRSFLFKYLNPIFDAHVHVHPIHPSSIDKYTEKSRMYRRLKKLERISKEYNVEKFSLIIRPKEDVYREEIKRKFTGSYLGLYIKPSIIEHDKKKILELLSNYNFIKTRDEDFYYISSKKLLKLFENSKGNIPNIIQIHTSPYSLGHNEFRSFMNLLMSKYEMKVHLVHGVYALGELENEKAEDIVKWITKEGENIVLGTSNFIPFIELTTHPISEILDKYELEDKIVFESDLFDGIPLEQWEEWFRDSLESVLKGIIRLRRKKLEERELTKLIFFENAEKFYAK